MASWPTTLPNPQVSGYTLKPVDQTVRTDMEGGASRARRRTKARNDKVSASWSMTDAQLAIFRAWFDDDTAGAAGGAAWFTCSLPVGATGLSSVTAKFIGSYTVPLQDGWRWVVTGELEIR